MLESLQFTDSNGCSVTRGHITRKTKHAGRDYEQTVSRHAETSAGGLIPVSRHCNSRYVPALWPREHRHKNAIQHVTILTTFLRQTAKAWIRYNFKGSSGSLETVFRFGIRPTTVQTCYFTGVLTLPRDTQILGVKRLQTREHCVLSLKVNVSNNISATQSCIELTIVQCHSFG